VGAEVGIIECLTISRSVNEIKKLFRMTFLTDFFERAYEIFRHAAQVFFHVRALHR